MACRTPNEGLAQWRHYLAWTDFAIFACCWLALKMCWKPPPRQAPGRYRQAAKRSAIGKRKRQSVADKCGETCKTE